MTMAIGVKFSRPNISYGTFEKFASLRDIICIFSSVSWKSVWIEILMYTKDRQRRVAVTRILLTMSEMSICKLLLWQDIDTHYRKITRCER